MEEPDNLVMDITYYMRDGDFNIDGEIKKDHHRELIDDFLCYREANPLEKYKPTPKYVYHIRLKWFPENDSIESYSDTKDLGLRDSILIDILSKLK